MLELDAIATYFDWIIFLLGRTVYPLKPAIGNPGRSALIENATELRKSPHHMIPTHIFNLPTCFVIHGLGFSRQSDTCRDKTDFILSS